MIKIIDPSSKEVQDALLIISEYKKNPDGYDKMLLDQNTLLNTITNIENSKKWMEEFNKIIGEIPAKNLHLIMYFISRNDVYVENISGGIFKSKIQRLKFILKEMDKLPLWSLQRLF